MADVAQRRTCRQVTHAHLVRDWRKALDAFGDALADKGEERYFSSFELRELERHLAADRRWLADFAAIRNFP